MDVNIINLANWWLRMLIIFEAMIEECKRLLRIRRWWVKPHLQERLRERYGAYHTIFTYFKLHDHEEFRQFVGMTVNQFEYLYKLVDPLLRKKSIRKPLATELRLAAVLNYLVHGNNVRKSSWFFRIGRSTMYRLVPEVCKAICKVLRKKYLNFPTTKDEWQCIADNFDFYWNMPNCVGSLDGKHIRIKAPRNTGSKFFNYKKFFSLVLMGMCDPLQRFIWINIGDYGSLNDAGIFQWSDLGQALERGEIDFPAPRALPRTEIVCPYFIVGDGGFPLKSYLMRPFSRGANYGNREKIFNYRLSRARRIIECAFGTLTKSWRVLESPLDWKLETDEIIILAIICMHNFLITSEMNAEHNLRYYAQDIQKYELSNIECDDKTDEDDHWSDGDDNGNNFMGHNIDENPIQIRNLLTNYFMSNAGAVPWQWEKVLF